MHTSISIRAASVAMVSLVAAIGISAPAVLSAPLNPAPTVQQLPTQSIQSGTVIKSPNGQFSLAITDDGILMQGPGGSVHIDQTEIEVKGQSVKVSSAMSVNVSGSQSVSVASSGMVNVSASSRVQVTGTQVALNGGCAPVARYADSITTYAMYGPSPGMITSGSPTVLAC